MSDAVLAHAHDHHFGQQCTQPGQQRTVIVLVLTVVVMLGEIAAGLAFGSIALLADGLHMGSHAVALGVALFVYALARRCSGNPRFSFGPWKMNSLGRGVRECFPAGRVCDRDADREHCALVRAGRNFI